MSLIWLIVKIKFLSFTTEFKTIKMKKRYATTLLIICSLAVNKVFGQTLLEVQCNINQQYTEVTDQVSGMYVFDYDGSGNDISDGVNDMYDSGNFLNTDLASSISYSDDVILSSTDFGTNGQYFTRELPGLFLLVADLDNVQQFYIDGNNGADSDGFVEIYDFSLTVFGIDYNVYHKKVWGAGDPTINHFIIIPANNSASHGYSTDTDDDGDTLSNISATTRLYYFLVSSSSGSELDDSESEAIAEAFLKAIQGGNSLQINASATEVCEGDQVTLAGIGSGSFTWNNSVTNGNAFTPPVGSTEYIVSGIGSNGCANKASIIISTLELPEFTLSTTDELYNNDGSVYMTLINGSFPFSYDWDNDGTGDFNDPQNLIGVGPGTYTVVVQSGNGCTSTASAVVGSQVSLIENNKNELNVFPNPATVDFTIQLAGEFQYQLVDLSGKTVLAGKGSNLAVVSLTNFASGAYMLNVSSSEMVQTIPLNKR
jgi:hypothetical protein